MPPSTRSLALSALTVLSASSSCAALAQEQAGQSRQIWNFTSYVDIENSVLRPNGHLLFTTLTSPQLWTIDPSADAPTAEVVRWLPGNITALTGIAAVGDDVFAVIGGNRGSFHYTHETIFTVDFNSNATDDANPNATEVAVVAELPDAIMLNGMAALPTNPRVLVVADSRVGCLWRVDVDTGLVTQAISNPWFDAVANATQPIGVDGLKLAADGTAAYFTNVDLEVFGRIPIRDNGTALVATGDVEILATFAGDDNWDDLALAGNDTVAYGAMNPGVVARVDLGTGEMTVVVNDTTVQGGPTSVVLKGDGVHAYVTTRGDSTTLTSGQIYEVTLS